MPVAVVILPLLLAAVTATAAPPIVPLADWPAAPVTADLAQILDAPTGSWRSPSIEVYRWDRFPDILILDTASFAVQDRLFTRLAYYLEKRGWRGRLLGNAQLAGRHGWNAHDYGAAGLASFFNAAAASHFPLNTEEIGLRRLAESQGIVRQWRGGLAPGRGGVLGISRSSSRIERRLLLTHEAFHGVYFSSASYRDFCQALWDSLPSPQREFYTSFLDSLGYDVTAPTLLVNEFQAYLMQQPLAWAGSYFERFLSVEDQRAARTGETPTVMLQELKRDAGHLDDFLRSRYGFGAGGPLLASLGSPAQ